MNDLAHELQNIYDQVPATCCAQSGECCVLTADEFSGSYATMFPLYSAEYLNISDFLRHNFSAELQVKLFNFSEERPRRCPFLGADHGCTVYPVRPLICRTYAVMNPQTIEAATDAQRGLVSDDRIHAFVAREGSMICPRVTVKQPQKLARHARNLMEGSYERELNRLSQAYPLVEGERLHSFTAASPVGRLPLRWTWGGFNALVAKPLGWVRNHFKDYWRRAELVDAL